MRLRIAVVVAVLVTACGHRDAAARPHAASNPTVVKDEGAMDRDVASATDRALHDGKRLLLVFVGDAREPDTRLVVRLLDEEPAAAAVERGYERVYVNVGADVALHPRLRHAHDVTAVVTFVVVDPASGRRVARRVFAPATGTGTVTSSTLAAWLDDPRGR